LGALWGSLFLSLDRRRYHFPMVTSTRKKSPAFPSLELNGETELSTQALRRFRMVFNAVKTHFQQIEKRSGVGGAQMWALSVIREQPGIGVGDLARAMDVHQSTASNLVKSLVENGMVASAKDGLDRRALRLRLLPPGSTVLKRTPGPLQGVLPEALKTLDPKTLKRLNADLDQLLTVLKADERAAWIPLSEL
jgi:DNA-binding MarR family transcriptional regulator